MADSFPVLIIASGPSLAADDIALIQLSQIYTICVNSSWKLAPFCQDIFAGDTAWWAANADEISIPAKRWCCVETGYGCRRFAGMSGWNSGANAILFALKEKKASSILLTGFDCSLKHGTHVHGDHVKNKNPRKADVERWHSQFSQAAYQAKKAGVPLLNCSRYTEITSIQRAPLAEAIHGGQHRIHNKRAG
jgi:hypothetical protein